MCRLATLWSSAHATRENRLAFFTQGPLNTAVIVRCTTKEWTRPIRKIDDLGFLPLADTEAPEGRELRRTSGVERVGWVGYAGMIRPDIDLADHAEPCCFKGGE